jgi:hypothetical protein
MFTSLITKNGASQTLARDSAWLVYLTSVTREKEASVNKRRQILKGSQLVLELSAIAVFPVVCLRSSFVGLHRTPDPFCTISSRNR